MLKLKGYQQGTQEWPIYLIYNLFWAHSMKPEVTEVHYTKGHDWILWIDTLVGYLITFILPKPMSLIIVLLQHFDKVHVETTNFAMRIKNLAYFYFVQLTLKTACCFPYFKFMHQKINMVTVLEFIFSEFLIFFPWIFKFRQIFVSTSIYLRTRVSVEFKKEILLSSDNYR